MSKYNLTGLVLENKLQLAEGTRAMVAFLGKRWDNENHL